MICSLFLMVRFRPFLNLNSVRITQPYTLCPEIYADIVFEGSHTCAAEFDIGVSDSKLAVVAGVSKGADFLFKCSFSFYPWL